MSLAYDAQDELSEDQERMQREEKLLRVLKSEEEEALGYAQTEITQQQIEALRRYMGETYGDEEEGRSAVTTREVMEAIEWQRPDFARVVAPGGNILQCHETSPEDGEHAEDVKNYLEWIMWADNPGYEIIDDGVFDGLLHRRGYWAVYWRDNEYRAPQTLTGLDITQVQALLNDPQVEIIGQDFDNEASEAGGITLVVRRMKSPARAEVVSIAPEDMRLSGRMVTLDSARYVGRVVRMFRGEAARMWPKKAEDLRGYSKGEFGATRRSDDVRQERFGDDDDTWQDANSDEASVELEILEEYLRIDLDGDGYPELIRSYRCGDCLLEESEVEETPFASWTPHRIPHRFMGMSVHDTVSDIQRQSTVITRAGLDALYQAVVNREALDTNKVDLASASATYAGAKVLVNGSPGDAILPLTGGLNTAEVAWQALEVLARRLEDRTGSTRQTRGIDVDALSKEHSGKALQQLQMNSDALKELRARNLAAGLGELFTKLYRLVCRNQNAPRQAKVGGEWCVFDPRPWNSDMRISVHIGTTNREQQLMGLTLIGQEQEKVIAELGPGNPNVTPANRFRYQEDLCRLAGHKDASPYFTPMPPDWQPPPQQDPAMAKVQADTQAKQADHQLNAQSKAADHQLRKEEAGAKIEAQREEAAAKIQVMREEAAARMEVMREELAGKLQLQREQMAADAALAQQKMAQDYELERLRIESAERVGKAKAAQSSSEAPKVDTDVNGR